MATPLGNLEDISFRATRVLAEVDLILAEDTRRTRILLTHYKIQYSALKSLHEHNEYKQASYWVEKLLSGISIAVCSDAGTPLLSDPGEILVRQALKAGVFVEPIPGPNAAINALIASGLSAKSFRFEGFLPRQSTSRKNKLAMLSEETATHIFYESPKRLREFLHDLNEVWPKRQLCIAREMTKQYEEFLYGNAKEVLEKLADEILGEITVVVEGNSKQQTRDPSSEEALVDLTLKIALQAGASLKDASLLVAKELKVSKKFVYQRGLELQKVFE